MPVITRTISIKSSGSKVYQLVKDVARYPQFIPDVKAVEIVSEDCHTRVTKWHVIIDGVEFRWLEREELDDSNWVVKYHLLEGDLQKFEGEWRVRSDGNRAVATLVIDYELGIPSFEEIMGIVLPEKVAMNAESLLRGVKQEAEKQV